MLEQGVYVCSLYRHREALFQCFSMDLCWHRHHLQPPQWCTVYAIDAVCQECFPRCLSHLDIAGYILLAVENTSVLCQSLPTQQLVVVWSIDQGRLLQSLNLLSVCEAAVVHHHCLDLQTSHCYGHRRVLSLSNSIRVVYIKCSDSLWQAFDNSGIAHNRKSSLVTSCYLFLRPASEKEESRIQ